jgi:uncharacterized YigZ family protein
VINTLAHRMSHEAGPTKGSRFIVTAAPVESETVARSLLEEVATRRPDATHHCWAWRIADPAIDRAGDAGEPSGSAGRPILAQLVGRGLVNTAVVVTRYFGGTKLGVGGLVRAYGGATGEALDRAEIVPYRPTVDLWLAHAHGDGAGVELAVAKGGATVLESEYLEMVRRHVRVPVDAREALMELVADATSGRATWLSTCLD